MHRGGAARAPGPQWRERRTARAAAGTEQVVPQAVAGAADKPGVPVAGRLARVGPQVVQVAEGSVVTLRHCMATMLQAARRARPPVELAQVVPAARARVERAQAESDPVAQRHSAATVRAQAVQVARPVAAAGGGQAGRAAERCRRRWSRRNRWFGVGLSGRRARRRCGWRRDGWRGRSRSEAATPWAARRAAVRQVRVRLARAAVDPRGGVPGAGGEDDPMIVGMVDAPGGQARVDEEVTPQTLGGMLPMVVGVDEQGQFDFDQAVLRAEVKVVLDGLAVQLQDAEYDRLDIIGLHRPHRQRRIQSAAVGATRLGSGALSDAAGRATRQDQGGRTRRARVDVVRNRMRRPGARANDRLLPAGPPRADRGVHPQVARQDRVEPGAQDSFGKGPSGPFFLHVRTHTGRSRQTHSPRRTRRSTKESTALLSVTRAGSVRFGFSRLLCKFSERRLKLHRPTQTEGSFVFLRVLRG